MSILALLSDHRGATQVTPFVRSPAPAEAASAHSTQRCTVSSGESPPLSRSFFDSSRLSRFALRSRPATGPNCPRPRPVCIVRPSDGFRADPESSLSLSSPPRDEDDRDNRTRERNIYDTRVYNNIYIYIYPRRAKKRESIFLLFRHCLGRVSVSRERFGFASRPSSKYTRSKYIRNTYSGEVCARLFNRTG